MIRTHRLALALSLLLAAAVTAPSASAHAQSRDKKPSAAPAQARSAFAAARAGEGARADRGKGSRSVGAPNGGRLDGGLRLKPNQHLVTRKGARTWGLPLLTRLLRRTADRMATLHRGSVMLVGDMSRKGGGPIDGHNSHQSGRDADIGFFITNSKGKPIDVRRFISFDGEGRGKEIEWARFDDARNWQLVETLLKDEAGVRYIFVSSGLRARLLAHAAKKRAPKELVARAAAAMMAPSHAEVHDDHFHVRIACPATMRECTEESGRPSASLDAPVSEPAPDAPAPAVTGVADPSDADPYSPEVAEKASTKEAPKDDAPAPADHAPEP